MGGITYHLDFRVAGREETREARLKTPGRDVPCTQRAVSGEVTGISVKLGIESERDSKEPAYTAALRFATEFENEFGTLACGVLIGCDLSTPEGRTKFQDEEVKAKKCAEFVGRSVEMAYDIPGEQGI